MLSGSSQDFIYKTMIHEGIHAIIDYWRSRMDQYYIDPLIPTAIDSNTFKNMFPIYWDYKRNLTNTELSQHYQIANKYINQIKSMLIQANPNLNESMADALAWSGLQETTVWKDKGSDTLRILTLQHLARRDEPDTTNYSLYKLKNCQ
jgi:hypothetical protein